MFHQSYLIILRRQRTWIDVYPSKILFVTPWSAACQAFLSFMLSLSLLKLMSTESVMPSNHLVIYYPLLFFPWVFPRRQKLTSMKEEINSNTIIVGDFNTPLTTMERSIKQKINKETQTLKDTMDQLDLIDIYRTFHPKTINFTFRQVHMEPSPE